MDAHRAYLDALLVWERAMHLAACPDCRPDGVSDAELARQCRDAATENARRRSEFRDLCQQLGYIPRLPFRLPIEDETWCRCKRAN